MCKIMTRYIICGVERNTTNGIQKLTVKIKEKIAGSFFSAAAADNEKNVIECQKSNYNETNYSFFRIKLKDECSWRRFKG